MVAFLILIWFTTIGGFAWAIGIPKAFKKSVWRGFGHVFMTILGFLPLFGLIFIKEIIGWVL